MPESPIRALSQHDLIVARATPPGPGAVAIVRVDGVGAGSLIRRLFLPSGKTHPADAPRLAILGRWIDPAPNLDSIRRSAFQADVGLQARPTEADAIDEGLTLFFHAPHSYTGNDLAELQCHGGPAVVRRLIRACVALGARPAQPGEFTRRAFLNGRMDLAQAEAVADLIAAETDAAARAARAQLAGALSAEVSDLRETLINLAAEIEARIDFPDEGLEEADLARLGDSFEILRRGLDRLIASRGRGRLLREGARVALIGPPNVGKSSLLNALARADRAIVTPHPGTTRDTVECVIDLGGVAVTLVDTAGLRESEDPIERLGIERSRRAIDEVDCVVEVRDATGEIAPLDRPKGARAPDLVVENKTDLMAPEAKRGVGVGRLSRADAPGPPSEESALESRPTLRVSAATGEGIEALEDRLKLLIAGDAAAGGAWSETAAVGARHAVLLEESRAALAEARRAWDEGSGGELAMIDLREALARLDGILGLAPSEAILDRVFSRFCIGK